MDGFPKNGIQTSYCSGETVVRVNTLEIQLQEGGYKLGQRPSAQYIASTTQSSDRNNAVIGPGNSNSYIVAPQKSQRDDADTTPPNIAAIK